MIRKLFGSPSYTVAWLGAVAIALLGFTTPEYLKYWYILSAMWLMNVFLYRHIVQCYGSKSFKAMYVLMFVLPLVVECAALVVPYHGWNPFFRSVSTSLVLTYVLFMQMVVAVLGCGCLHHWYRQDRGRTFSAVARRRYRVVAYSVFALCFACYMVGAIYGKNHVVLRRATVEVCQLPQAFEGYKIVQLSDFHLGSMYNSNTMARIVDSVNALNPDMIAVTGDVVTLSSGEMRPFLSILRRLKAKDGVYMVLGNHDYVRYPYFPSPEVKTTDSLAFISMIVDSLRWNLLCDQSRFILRNADTMVVAGSQYIGLPSLKKIKLVGDNTYSYGDLAKTLRGTDGYPVVLLTHNPVVWTREVIQRYPFVDLTLSGHTHAGQMGLYIKNSVAQNVGYNAKTKAGLFHYADQSLYVNAGIGTSAMHSRFLIFPEITLITLTASHPETI